MTRPRVARFVLVAAVAVALVLIFAAGRRYWRGRASTPPVVAAEDLDPEVARVIEEARQAVIREPRSGEAWGELAILLFAHNLPHEARICFQQAETLDATDARWPYGQALVLLAEDPEQALPPLERSAQRSGREVAPKLRLAETLIQLGRLNEADAALAEVARLQPRHPRLALAHGLIARERGQLERCEELLTPLVQQPSTRQVARRVLADVCARRGRTAEADEHRRIAESLPSEVVWSDALIDAMMARQVGLKAQLRRTSALFSRGDWERALPQALLTTQLYPDVAEAQVNLARVHLAMGDPAAAEAPLRRAIGLLPDPASHYLLGVSFWERNRTADAEAEFRRAVQLKPDDALAHFQIGRCRMRHNDPAGALESFRTALRYRPHQVDVHVEAAAALLQQGDKAAAVAYLRDALRLNPQHGRAAELLRRAEQ